AGGGHSPGDDAPVRQALAYIHRHYRENVTLEQLAAAAGDGSAARPFSTIGAAAAAAQPGDTVLIHSGIYREWV
ncbi:hypothetical protein H6B10_17135, partial [Gemmiger formicilis]|uniref:hypothetical protein n=1 Tax=Gemmiger formicilis TaxID=745368 RepID=UPI001958D2DE